MSHIDVVLCKLLTTLPEKENKMINVIFGETTTDDDEFLRHINIPVVVETIDNLADIKHKRNFNLVFIESEEDMRKFRLKFTSKLFNSRGYFIIISNYDDEDVFKWFWDNQILNVNVVRSNLIFSYFPFNENECDSTKPIIISKFTENSSFDRFFPDKMSNLHNCVVRMATSKISEPYVIVNFASDGTVIRLYGRDISLINTLSQKINFKVDYVYIGDEGALYDDGVAHGPFKYLLDNKADLIFVDYWLMPSRLKYIDSSLPYISQHIAFIIPPGAPFSSFEKLILPFDHITWTILISIFLISFFVILGARRHLPENICNYIFGISSSSSSSSSDPYMNIIRAILGGSQKILPNSNCSRILLMALLMLCLVMRTLYQASLFQFMRSNIQHREVQSIDDMIDRDFDVYYLTSTKHLFEDSSERLRNRMKPLTVKERSKLIKNVFNPSFKGAFLRSLTATQYINQVSYNTTEVFTICKENFMTIPVVIYARKNFYLVDKIDEKILDIQAAGLVEYWHSLAVDEKYLKVTQSSEPTKLSMNHLFSCFSIWLFGLFIALIIFMVENCKFLLSKIRAKKKLDLSSFITRC